MLNDEAEQPQAPIPSARKDWARSGKSFDSLGETSRLESKATRKRVAVGRARIGTAVVGYGYWGPNLVRNVCEQAALDLRALCESAPDQRRAFAHRFPQARPTDQIADVLEDRRIAAIVIATPPDTHYRLAKLALEAGKHVLVEKPLATTLEDAEDLVRLAVRSGRLLMPGHTFIYSPAVNAVSDAIKSGDLGDIHFITSSRMNLGKYTRAGVICDLAPHDLSILLHWLQRPLLEVSATGSSVLRKGVAETAFMTYCFAGGTTANVQISWLAPRKLRQMIVVGSRRMVQYDDTAADEPVRIYDRGLDMLPPAPRSFGEHQLVYRTGDVLIPRINPAEPLSLELADFATSIREGTEPQSSMTLGLSIVAALESAEHSMKMRGAPQRVSVPAVAQGDSA